MKKQRLALPFLLFIGIFSFFSIKNTNELSTSIENPAYQEYLDEYQQLINQNNYQRNNEKSFSSIGLNYHPPKALGTTSNFEGPLVLLKGLKFHDEFLYKEDERLKHIDGISAHFDPDHPYFGLPDVRISIQDVRRYDASYFVLFTQTSSKGLIKSLLNLK